MINGKATRGDVNIRNQPKVVSGSITGLLVSGSNFKGTELVNETATRLWIKLSEVDGIPKVGFVAAWCVSYVEDAAPVPPPVDDPIVSGELTLASGAKVRMVVVND